MPDRRRQTRARRRAGTPPLPNDAGGAADHIESAAPLVPSRGVCPYYHEAVELLGKRWTGAIVHALLPGPMRFSEIAQAIPQISDRLLSMRLRELEAAASWRAGSGTARRCGSSTS